MADLLESLRSNWKVTLLAVIMLPILFRLGFWQLDRADEKRAVEAMYLQRAAQLPLTSQELNQHCDSEQVDHLLSCDPEALAFRLLNLQGRYIDEYSALLDNQIQQSRPGYHVLTPFLSDDGRLYWINRGWIAATPDRALPEIPATPEKQQLAAGIYLPQGEAIVLTEDRWSNNWPVLMQAIDIQKLVDHLPEASNLRGQANIFPYLLRLEPGYAGELDIDWPLLNMKAQMHTGYAVQWFAMAFAVTLFWFYLLAKGRN